jgi:hypothetical protein
LTINLYFYIFKSMAARPRTWPTHEDAESMRIGMIWPKHLWKELQHVALEEDTSATALVIEAVEMLLTIRKKGGSRNRDRKE